MKAMLFIARMEGTRDCWPLPSSNYIWPRAKAHYQPSKLLGNEEKKTEMKTMMEQGSRPELQVEVTQISNSSLHSHGRFQRAINKVLGSPA